MVRFGSCAVDVAARTVTRDDVEQHLEPQAFDLLAYLVAHRGRVIPKAELLDEVWGDQFVSESALTTRIKEIRAALGDDGVRQQVVKNFRGRGYRFVAEIDDRPSPRFTRPSSLATRLHGRDDDVDGTTALLESTRLLTLTGPGGVGKTTLALEIARLRRERGLDVSVVRLAPLRDPHGVVHVVRRETGLLETVDEDALVEAIAALDAVVVIDNCEHVLDEARRVIDAIMRAPGPVRLVATSRERLGLPGEQVWPVAPLSDVPARRLLLERSQLVQPSYSWATQEEASIDTILAAVDRLPLAIEMAAARLPSIGAADLARLLAERLDLLSSSDHSADRRHRTLGALIEWSMDLLSAEELDLLAALTVFAGPVGASDIAAIVGADRAELELGPLGGLVGKSLVVTDASRSPTRYRLLETVRAGVVAHRPPTIEARHADHIVEVVAGADRTLRTPDERRGAERLDALVEEIRIAHRWARQHAPHRAAELTASLLSYSHERQWTEPAAWAREVLDEHGVDDPISMSASAALAADASNRGDYASASRHASRAVDSDDVRVAASAHDTLVSIGLYTGDLDSSYLHAAALCELGRRAGDSAARTTGALGMVLARVYAGRTDDVDDAIALLRDTTQMGSTSLAWAAYGRGEYLVACGRPEEAIAHFDRAIELGNSVGSTFVANVARVSALAAAVSEAGTDAVALAGFVPVLTHYRRIRSLTHGTTAIRNLIEGLVRTGHDEPAMVLLGALSEPGAKSTYGVESRRLDEAVQAVERRAGATAARSWFDQGSVHGTAWAIDYAIDVLTRIGAAHHHDGASAPPSFTP